MSDLKPCYWCSRPASKLYHHGEYSWSEEFCVGEEHGKRKIRLYVCDYCGKVTIIYGD